MNGLWLPLNPKAVLPEPWCHANLICKAGQVKCALGRLSLAKSMQCFTVFQNVHSPPRYPVLKERWFFVAGSIQVVIILKAGSLLCLFLLPGGSEVPTVSASDHENVEIRPDGPRAAFQQEVWINALLLEKRLLTTALWGVCSIPWVATSAPSQEILLQAREEGSEIAEVLTPGLPNRNRSGWGCLAYCFIW